MYDNVEYLGVTVLPHSGTVGTWDDVATAGIGR